MVTNSEIKLAVINALRQLPICKPNSAATQWVVRCPYCGDSQKHFDHGHFSILIDPNAETPMLYRCLRCNEVGLLSAETLEDLGLLIDREFAQDLKRSFRRVLNTEYYQMKPKDYKLPHYEVTPNNQEKLYYLNSRLDTGFTLDDMEQNRIILSIGTFLEHNKIHNIPGITPQTIGALESDYIGFISSNRNRIVFRSIRENPKYRYFKLILDPRNLSRDTFFALPSRFNLYYTDPVHVHMAEGTFDILSIKYNLPHNEPGLHLFYASCGFNFNTIIRYLVAKGVNTDIHAHIYSDRDKADREHLKYLSAPQSKYWLDHVQIHRNQYSDEKDYGVPGSRIVDSFITLR